MSMVFKRFIIILPIVVACLLFFQVKSSQIVHAADAGAGNDVCETLAQASGKDCGDEKKGTAISDGIKAALNMLSILAGVLTVVMLIIGGVKYITSQGDPGSTTSARNTIIYAIIGIVIVALSQTIVFFVIDSPNATPNAPNSTLQKE